jgi:hypothetical protein
MVRLPGLSMRGTGTGLLRGKGKCAGKSCRINQIRIYLVFRGPDDYSSHNANEVSALPPKLVFGDVSREVGSEGTVIEGVLGPLPGPSAGQFATRWSSPGFDRATSPGSSAVAPSGTPACRRPAAGLPLADSAGTTGGRWCTVSSGSLAS